MQKSIPINTHRVITMVDRRELEFLDKLGKDALFSTSHKLSYNEILRGLLEFAMSLELDGKNISSAQALKEKILQLLHQPRSGIDNKEVDR